MFGKNINLRLMIFTQLIHRRLSFRMRMSTSAEILSVVYNTNHYKNILWQESMLQMSVTARFYPPRAYIWYDRVRFGMYVGADEHRGGDR